MAKGTPTKYNDRVPVDAYILAKTGLSNMELARALNIHITNFNGWVQKHEALRYAIDLARKDTEKTEKYADYVYNHLSEDMRKLWDEIEWNADQKNGHELTQTLLGRYPTRVRQQLWLHAMIATNFNASEACRIVNVPLGILQGWGERDPKFQQLVREMEWHKGNFFEKGLLKLAEEGHPLAVIFANRTYNAKRGYSDKLTIEHTGTINHNVLPLHKLKLSVECLLEIETAMKELQQAEEAQKQLTNGSSDNVMKQAIPI